jgi:hypothetical protein
MATAVVLSELIDALDWVSAAGPFENAAYVSRDTGRIYLDTDTDPEMLGEELPSDVEDDELYACIPHKNDLDLGRRLAIRFTEEHMPECVDRVVGYFSRSGAYGRFKAMLEDAGFLGKWYEYESNAAKAALREWAEAEGFAVADGPRDEA